MGKSKSKKPVSVFIPRLGVKEVYIAKAMRAGGHIHYDADTGYFLHLINGAACKLDNAVVSRLLVKKVISGTGDAMFGQMPQSFVFDSGCLR